MASSLCDIINFTKLTVTEQFKQQLPQRLNLNIKQHIGNCTMRMWNVKTFPNTEVHLR